MIDINVKNKIKSNSINLNNFGLNDLAWKKDEALKLINSIMSDSIGILGGDVYKIELTNLIPIYDNWSCQKKTGETTAEYLLRSKNEALDYIKRYPIESNEEIIFAIIYTETMD